MATATTTENMIPQSKPSANLIPKVTLESATIVPTKTYWMGIKPDSNCPREVVHVNGLDFPLYTEVITRVQGQSEAGRSRQRGVVRELTQQQVDGIIAKVGDWIIRSGRLITKHGKHFVPMTGDRPLADCLYLQQVTGGFMAASINPTIERAMLRQAEDAELIARSDFNDEAHRKVALAAKLSGEDMPSLDINAVTNKPSAPKSSPKA